MHDIYEPADPPYRKQIPIYTPVGSHRFADHHASTRRRSSAWWRPIWRTKRAASASQPADRTRSATTWPSSWRPAGRGHDSRSRSCRFNRAWATSPTRCWARWAAIRAFLPFEMYTEVLQDSVVDLLEQERVHVRQQLLVHRDAAGAEAGVRQPGVLPLARRAAAAGDQQQSRKSSGGWASSRSTRRSRWISSAT